MAELQATEPELVRKLTQLASIPSIGMTTAVIVVAETSYFALVENERQLASHAGLDMVQRKSGLAAHAIRTSKRLRTAL